jgi:NADH-quinone oxidoreductase subunit M
VREKVVMVPLIAVIVGIGLYPKPLYERVTPTVDAILAEIDAPGAVSAAEPAN